MCLCVCMGHYVCLFLLLPLAMHAHVRVCVCRPPCASGPCGTHILEHVYASPMCVCLPGAHVSGVSLSSCVACLTRPEAFYRLCVTDHDPPLFLSLGATQRPALSKRTSRRRNKRMNRRLLLPLSHYGELLPLLRRHCELLALLRRPSQRMQLCARASSMWPCRRRYALHGPPRRLPSSCGCVVCAMSASQWPSRVARPCCPSVCI
jgi:hypothetical protein